MVRFLYKGGVMDYIVGYESSRESIIVSLPVCYYIIIGFTYW